MERVRARDRRCVITGQVVRRNNFSGFQAAHIFPLAQLDKVWCSLFMTVWAILMYISSGILANGVDLLQTTLTTQANRRFTLCKMVYF
jgi:hypothetical protein